ncbi:MAG TPA: chemotaxis protein CheW [Terriglobia bacterium]|nr:chemotaxis protein CheW [Terriglobia bacterium]
MPQVSLLELVRLEGDEARTGIESVHGAPVYRLRGNLLSLVYLNLEFELSAAHQNGAAARDVVNTVVLQADDRQFGLVVDEVNDTEEIAVKPLGQHQRNRAMWLKRRAAASRWLRTSVRWPPRGQKHNVGRVGGARVDAGAGGDCSERLSHRGLAP